MRDHFKNSSNYRSTKFRFTYHEFHEVLTFMDTLRNKGHEDAEFTFVKMFTDNAFHFTATSSEVSFDTY